MLYIGQKYQVNYNGFWIGCEVVDKAGNDGSYLLDLGNNITIESCDGN